MAMKIINRGRQTGKTLALICASYINESPIVVLNQARKTCLLEQAKRLGYKVEVYTVREMQEITKYNHGKREVLVDEATALIEEALSSYLGAPVKAITMTEECFNFPKDPEEAKTNAN